MCQSGSHSLLMKMEKVTLVFQNQQDSFHCVYSISVFDSSYCMKKDYGLSSVELERRRKEETNRLEEARCDM